MEVFSHHAGGANPGGENPNWFYYWSQIAEPEAADGNPQLQFEEGEVSGADALWKGPLPGNGSRIRIEGPDKDGVTSLAFYVGLLAHEQQHENDFYNVIWEGNGYDGEKDNDGDTLRDDWEAEQVMEGEDNDWGPWTFDVPDGADGDDPDKDNEVWAETQKIGGVLVVSWSDERADNAAKAAVDDDTEINKKDWSDLDVDAKTHRFYDSDGGDKEVTDKVDGNNKDYHP